MVQHVDDQRFYREMAERIVLARLSEIEAILTQQTDGKMTPADAWQAIIEVLQRS